jgi:hypothetical protein
MVIDNITIDLEMIPNERIKIIDSLKSIDYREGPNIDKMGSDSDL